MKCRHCNAAWEHAWEYCPECNRNFGGAVYPESQTPEELAEIELLIRRIHDAFAGSQLEDGTTIHEADLEGWHRNEQERLQARAEDAESDWSEVPDWKMERFSSALCFLDVKGWRFYIPAYMIWTLRNWRTTSFITADFVVWSFVPTIPNVSLPRYESLSLAQAHVVHRFIKYFCDYSGDAESRHAMDAYWHQFAPDAASE